MLNCKQRPGLGFTCCRSVLWATMGHLPSPWHWALKRARRTWPMPSEVLQCGAGSVREASPRLRDEKETPHQKQKEGPPGQINGLQKPLPRLPIPTCSPRPVGASVPSQALPEGHVPASTSRSWAARVPGPPGPPVPGTQKGRGAEWAQGFHFYLKLGI